MPPEESLGGACTMTGGIWTGCSKSSHCGPMSQSIGSKHRKAHMGQLGKQAEDVDEAGGCSWLFDTKG